VIATSLWKVDVRGGVRLMRVSSAVRAVYAYVQAETEGSGRGTEGGGEE
jgi:hypothetical protein